VLFSFDIWQKAWRLAGFGVIEIPILLRKLNLIDQLNNACQSQWFQCRSFYLRAQGILGIVSRNGLWLGKLDSGEI